jgi:O-antigen ligase
MTFPPGRKLSTPSVLIRVTALLMVASTVVWRRGDIFSGSFDAVVVGKAVLSVVALLLAFLTAQSRGSQRLRLGTGTVWLLAGMVSASMLGALAHGTWFASGVVAVRMLILAATVFFLLRAAPAMMVLGSVVWACGVVAAVAAVTGLWSLTEGRIFGGVPPLNPNELALLAGVVMLWISWRTVLGEARWRNAILGAGFLVLLWLTGSRTGLLACVLAVAVIALHIRRPRVGLVVGGLVVLALGSVAVMTTGLAERFLDRGGVGTSTLESRFIAWNAAQSWAESPWQWAFGGGLSVKLIPVKGQWWTEQLLDSSWVSALVQAGLVGLGIAAVWSAWAVVGSFRAPRPHRIFFLGMLAFLLGRSVLESGLFDATPAFLIFMAVSLLAEGASRSRLRQEASGGPVEKQGYTAAVIR